MPESGIDDQNFDRPTTDRKKRRPAEILKLPVEYTEFRLSDGRFLGEVLGEKFFEPASGARFAKPVSDSVRATLRDGNWPLAGMMRDNPRMAPRPEPAGGIPGRGRAKMPAMSADALAGAGIATSPIPSGDNEAEFTNLPFGAEEGDAPDSLPGLAISRKRHGIIGDDASLQDAEAPGEREFTPADILDPGDRLEFENRSVATASAERQKLHHRENLAFKEQQFKAGDISARAVGGARRYFEDEIAKLDEQIARNEMRVAEIRVKAGLDAAALSPRDRPRVEDAREEAEAARRRRTARYPLRPDGEGDSVADTGRPTHPYSPRKRQQAEQRLKAQDKERAEKEETRISARKRLPGVGTPAGLQEAYDRVDTEEKRLSRMGHVIDAEGMLARMGLDSVYRPDGSRPVDDFGARVEEYIKSSRSERAGFRDQISFDRAVSELVVTQANFRKYLDSFDKRADVHDDSFDEDVRKGQAAVDARKRDIRAVAERDKRKLIPDVGKPTNEPVDAALMYEKLGFDSDESRLSGYASLAGRPIDSWQANNILEEAAEIATRLAREGHFTLYSKEWDVFRHGYASVRITMEYGPWAAKRLGDVNETTRRNNPAGEALADLYNNNVGRKLAIETLTSAGSLGEVVLESVRRGDYPALGGGRRDWPLEEIVLKAIRDGKFQMQPFQLKQSVAPH